LLKYALVSLVLGELIPHSGTIEAAREIID
jgi:hypothetical protein